ITGAYITLSLVVAAPLVIDVLGGKGFAPAVPVLRLQSLALLGGFLGTTWSYTLLSLRMHGALLRVTLAGLVLSIGLSAALVPSLGAKGASIAAVAGEFVVAGGYALALIRSHPHLRPATGAVSKVALATAAGASVLLLPLPSIVLWVVASLVYLSLLLMLRAFPVELLHLLPKRGGGSGRA
ncbi:MAG: polysaccharide biosynthesis C-terminal domain-containing protein, partial [Actinomycetota bacterium]|nr:polysaccharide biosynthesis C-terminal domain-containing protein [Actinomycetota bacterium]